MNRLLRYFIAGKFVFNCVAALVLGGIGIAFMGLPFFYIRNGLSWTTIILGFLATTVAVQIIVASLEERRLLKQAAEGNPASKQDLCRRHGRNAVWIGRINGLMCFIMCIVCFLLLLCQLMDDRGWNVEIITAQVGFIVIGAVSAWWTIRSWSKSP